MGIDLYAYHGDHALMRRNQTGGFNMTKHNESQPDLETMDGYQTKSRGTNAQEYEIYSHMAELMGWPVKTYDEWVAS